MNKRILSVMVLLLLNSCAGLSAFGGAVGSLGSTYFGNVVGDDIRVTAVWRANHNALVQKVTAALVAHADELAKTDMEKAIVVYKKALRFSEDNQPKILLERLADRLRRARERKAAPKGLLSNGD